MKRNINQIAYKTHSNRYLFSNMTSVNDRAEMLCIQVRHLPPTIVFHLPLLIKISNATFPPHPQSRSPVHKTTTQMNVHNRPCFTTSLPVPRPSLRASRSTCPSFPRMSASTSAQLRRRISSVQSAEKIVSALRLVAAARIRSSSNAALRSRPFAEELQTVLSQLIHLISVRRIDLVSAANSAPPFTISDMHGPLLADPLVQTTLLNRINLALLSSPPSSHSSSSKTAPVTILTVVTADRKFCGSYNKDIIKRATQRIQSLEKAGIKVELILVGRIAQAHFQKDNHQHIHIRSNIPAPTSATAEECAMNLSQALLAEFIAGGIYRVEIVYTKFVSLIATVPSVRTLLPLKPTGLEALGDEIFQLTLTSRNGRIIPIRSTKSKSQSSQKSSHGHSATNESEGDPLFSPSTLNSSSSSSSQNEHDSYLKQAMYSISDEEAVLLLNSMLPMYFTSQMIRIIREAIASEQVSRLAAMTAATDNARDLISNLRTQYNKQRQARITTEIIEVISSSSS